MNDFICGKNAVLELLAAGREINRVYLDKTKKGDFHRRVIEACQQRSIPYSFVDKQHLDKIAGTENRGVVAAVAGTQYCEIADILAIAAEHNEAPLLVMLSEVEDPHNLGAIMRSALCAGAHGIIIPKRRAVGVTPTVAKVASGAAEYLPVARVPNLVQAAKELQAAGIWLIAADMNGDDIFNIDFSGPLAIVMGGEDKGISPLLLNKCDFKAKIPMKGNLGSYNVSASAAIFLYEALRARR